MKHHAAHLENRAIIKISGPDTDNFLSGLFTNSEPPKGETRFSALLTPQGKILFDFLISANADGYLIDINKDLASDFIKRLTFYKLRSNVTITDISHELTCIAIWGDDAVPDDSFKDPRHKSLGYRYYGTPDHNKEFLANHKASDETQYHNHRIALCIPEGGIDYIYSDNFPHDACYDQLAGIDFKKGCYIGQEVVSRMKHRGTARKRIIRIKSDNQLPATGTELTADGHKAGLIGSVNGNIGLALVRLDRIGQALNKGAPVLANESVIITEIPEWAGYSFESSK